jgi:hypothetical protein
MLPLGVRARTVGEADAAEVPMPASITAERAMILAICMAQHPTRAPTSE